MIFNDISTFIDDPTAFIDGMQALYNVINEEGLDIVEQLFDGYIQQFERKQAQNNPYGGLEEQEYPTLYRTFEANWYKGYAAGFLTKIVISAGVGKAAKTAIKQTDTAGDIARRLADTRALRALSRIQGTTDAAKARAIARILLASDDATEAVISQADTAGQAYRLWRIQRNNDLDVDSLPESDQSKVGEFLVRNGDDGAQVVADGGDDAIAVMRRFDGVDDDTADRLADLKRSGDLGTSDLNRLENALDNGEIDTGELRRTSEVLAESENFRYDDDVGVDEFIKLSDNDDLSDTVAVVEPDDTVTKDGITVNTVQLDTGDADTGRRHLLLRHVGGAERTEKPITNFWPVGQTVGGRTLPDAIDIEDVDRLTYRAIKNGDASDTGTEITYRYDDVDVEGIDEIIVKVDEQTGRVISSYPSRSGSAVDTYYGSADEWNIESE